MENRRGFPPRDDEGGNGAGARAAASGAMARNLKRAGSETGAPGASILHPLPSIIFFLFTLSGFYLVTSYCALAGSGAAGFAAVGSAAAGFGTSAATELV